MKLFSSFLLGLMLLAWPMVGFAQDEESETECVRTLTKAKRAYDEGLIEKVEEMISPCLEGTQMTKEEKLEGYKLLIMAKLYDDRKIEAEEAMLKFLKLEPEYRVQPGIDPKEFSEMFANYHTSPLYTIGIYAGLHVTSINTTVENGGYNTAEDKKQYTNRFGFQFGARITRYIYQGLNIQLEPGFLQNNIRYSHEILEGYTEVDSPVDGAGSSPSKGALLTSIETQNIFNLPLVFSYTFMRDKTFRPYVFLGGSMRYLLSATIVDTKEFIDPDIANIETSDEEYKAINRNPIAFTALGGLGIKWKIPKGEVSLEARYNYGLSQQVNEAKQNESNINDNARIWNHYEMNNEFSIDDLGISVGYSYYLFKPRKMKSKKAKDL